MSIYAVSGVDQSGQDTLLYIEAGSLDQALDAGHRRGLLKIDGKKLLDGELPDSSKVIKLQRGTAESPVHAVQTSDLHRSPVWTIAKGVALGLFLHSAIVFAILAILYFSQAIMDWSIWDPWEPLYNE